LAIVLSVLPFEGQTIQWPKERIDNTMAKRKDRQYNGQKKGQTLHWPKERTDNTLAKRKDRQYNDRLSFLLAIVLSILSFGQCIVCPFF
jgi:hypothetical protein